MNVLENIYPILNNEDFIDNISNRFEFNIPVINAGPNPHIAYKFSITPKKLNGYKKFS